MEVQVAADAGRVACAAPTDAPAALAVSRMDRSEAREARIASLVFAVMDGRPNGRPDFVPSARARARPEAIRSLIKARSNSLKTDNIPNMARPAAVVSRPWTCRYRPHPTP